MDNLKLRNVCVDWLSLTCSGGVRDRLLRCSQPIEIFGKYPGFEMWEKRSIGLDECRRYYTPLQRSSKFGNDYESWQFSSDAASRWMPKILTISAAVEYSYATRIDVAFDFDCNADYYPVNFIDPLRSHIKGRMIKINSGGPEFEGTRYIGSRSSGLMIRVYRKDMEDLTLKSPVMRVELECKGDVAKILYREACLNGLEYMIQGCAGHILIMTGFEVLPEHIEIPLQRDDGISSIGTSLYHMLIQYGPVLKAVNDAGLDLPGLLQVRLENAGRMTQWRYSQRKKELNREDLSGFYMQLLAMLQK